MRSAHVSILAAALAIAATTGEGQAVALESVPLKGRPSANSEFVLDRPVTVTIERLELSRALSAVAESANVRLQYDATVMRRVPKEVTLHAKGMPLGDALDRLFSGTSFTPMVVSANSIVIVERDREASVALGKIAGTVIDTRTKQPLSGVSLALDDASKGVTTQQDGRFSFASVAPGEHRIRARLLGYTRVTQVVTVRDGETTSIEITMAPSVNALDQVVVTGTAVATELKALPNAITVITAKQIEQRGITNVEQLFRGDIPGVIALSLPGSTSKDGATFMYSRGRSDVSQLKERNVIKTYVDGIELANPVYLTQIDPNSIERIEILTGPQASTIYGSNALNGVMQIFTKRGATNRPEVTLNLESGLIQNNFSSATTPKHNYSAGLRGIDGRVSYNLGGSWLYDGPWNPASRTSSLLANGGAHLNYSPTIGPVTADFTYRRSVRTNYATSGGSLKRMNLQDIGVWVRASSPAAMPQRNTTETQSVGMTVTYSPFSFWSHQLELGQDFSSTEGNEYGAAYSWIGDTTNFRYSQSRTDRRQITYSTTAQIPITSQLRGTVTFGADEWQSTAASGTSGWNATIGRTSIPIWSSPSHNAGGFVQAQIGLKDALFLTYGLRAEWNPTYGSDALPNMSPRYGIAWTQPLGEATTKLWASYGRSTRIPDQGAKDGMYVDAIDPGYLAAYDNFYYYMPNPGLRPEYNKGVELGGELYFGNRLSLGLTRYNQTIDGLILTAVVDSVRSLMPYPVIDGVTCDESMTWLYLCKSMDEHGYVYQPQSQNINLTGLRNQGWQFTGTLTTGPIVTNGTYTLAKSRAFGIMPPYQSQFLFMNNLQKGSSAAGVPERYWAVNFTYMRSQTSVTLHVDGRARTYQYTGFGDAFYYNNIYGYVRLQENRARILNANAYVANVPPYTTTDVIVNRRLSSHAEGVLKIRNVFNNYVADGNWGSAAIGRQSQLGLRIRL